MRVQNLPNSNYILSSPVGSVGPVCRIRQILHSHFQSLLNFASEGKFAHQYVNFAKNLHATY